MKAEDITDEHTLETWLNARPEAKRRSEAISIGTRCASRAFPHFGRDMDQEWATRNGLSALTVLRVNLTLGVSHSCSNAMGALVTARAVARASSTALARSAIYAADTAIATTSQASVVAAIATVRIAGQIIDVGGGPPAMAAFAEILNDAAACERGDNLFSVSLWSAQPSARFTQYDALTRAIWAEDPPGTWDFWIRWWEGVLSGQQLNWELQKAVALIPDAIWQQGPSAVASRIDLIIQARLLRAEAAAVRSKLLDLISNLDALGRFTHNNPPEDEAPLALRQRLKAIEEALSELEEELAEPEPDPEKLNSISDRLKSLWAALSLQTKIMIGAIVISVASGFFGAAGDDLYHAVKVNIPSLSTRVGDFATQLEAPELPTFGPR